MFVVLVWITYLKIFHLIIFSIDMKACIKVDFIYTYRWTSFWTCNFNLNMWIFYAQNIKFILHSLWNIYITNDSCHNPNLGLATKARACEVGGQEWSPKVTFHVVESVGQCEGMNPHTPKWVPTLGVGVPMDFQIFKEQL